MAPEARRAAIVDATLPLVLEHGTAVTVRQIAAAAGIAEGTIFTVFPDKDALIAAVSAKGFDPLPALVELAAVDLAQPLRARLVQVVEISQRRMRAAIGLVMALGLPHPPAPDAASERDRERSRVNALFLDAISQVIGPDEASLRVSARELAHVLQMLTFSATHPLLSAPRPLRPDEIVAVLLDGTLAAHQPLDP